MTSSLRGGHGTFAAREVLSSVLISLSPPFAGALGLVSGRSIPKTFLIVAFQILLANEVRYASESVDEPSSPPTT